MTSRFSIQDGLHFSAPRVPHLGHLGHLHVLCPILGHQEKGSSTTSHILGNLKLKSMKMQHYNIILFRKIQTLHYVIHIYL